MDIIKRVSLKYLPSFLVCLARNTDYKNNYGKCGPDYGRCNSYHNERFLYCDFATSECHDSEVKKNLQANDYFDSFPSSSCASNDRTTFFNLLRTVSFFKSIWRNIFIFH